MMQPDDWTEFCQTATDLRMAASRLDFLYGEEVRPFARVMQRAAAAMDVLLDEVSDRRAKAESRGRRLAEARAERDAMAEEAGREWDGAGYSRPRPTVAGPGSLPPQLAPLAGRVLEVDPGLLQLPRSVYFLVLGEKVVYVGESTRVLRRLHEHADDIDFDRAFVLEVPLGEAIRVESTFIMLFKPRHNRGSLEGVKSCDHAGILARYGFSPATREA